LKPSLEPAENAKKGPVAPLQIHEVITPLLKTNSTSDATPRPVVMVIGPDVILHDTISEEPTSPEKFSVTTESKVTEAVRLLPKAGKSMVLYGFLL